MKIDKKIVGWKISDKPESPDKGAGHVAAPLERDLELEGTTYRFRPGAPYKEAWVYVTINNVRIDDGLLRPFEVFINQKDPRQVEYITAIALMISANLRRVMGDISFIPGELMQMCSPNGGFFASKNSGLPTGQYIPSLVAAIGHVLNRHWQKVGVMEGHTSVVASVNDVPAEGMDAQSVSVDEAQRQSVGSARAVSTDEWCSNCSCAKIKQGGCATCPSCGSSSCQ